MALRLRYERKARGWTAQWVADQLGISRRMLVFIEQGQRQPSKKVIDKMEDLFGMNQRDLLEPFDKDGHVA